jgi:hypothetical protein
MHTAVRPLSVDIPAQQQRSSSVGIIAIALFILCGWMAVGLENPPEPQAVGISGFSAESALKHVSIIASKPHPIGSAHHTIVRDYILQTLAASGYSPQVQRATSGITGVAASVENIVARVDGTEGGKALLLAAHYDSVPWGSGAADDGAAVATLLEVARLLKSRPAPKRSVIFLFSDGEENGLLGARAFTGEHPWAKDAGVVLNFEARGSSGPVIMFETSNRSGWLLDNFAHASSRPVANSLSYEIYKRLPNDTDFTVFRNAGYSGLNFAFIDELSHYHSALDSTSRLSPASLQHAGDYALKLAEQFAGTTGNDPKTGNKIYFDVIGRWLVLYSYPAALLLIVLCGGMLATILLITRKNAQVKLLAGSGMVIAFALISALGAFAIAWLWGAATRGASQINLRMLYHPGLYVAAYSMLGLSLGVALFNLVRRRVNSLDLTMGAMAVWFVLGLVSTLFAPGASFVFIWPLLFNLAGLLVVAKLNNYPQLSGKLVLTLAALPGVLLVAPLLHQMEVAFTLGSTLVIAILSALLLALTSWAFGPEIMPRRLAPALLATGGVLTLIAAVSYPLSTKDNPVQEGLFYTLNADAGQQRWVTYDSRPDQWTSQLFGTKSLREPLTNIFPWSDRKVLQAPADLAPVPAPTLAVLEDKTVTSGRHLRLRLNSGRHAPGLGIIFTSASPIQNLTLNGVKSALHKMSSDVWTLYYYGLPSDGVEIAFDTVPGSVNLKLEDISWGLEEELQASRPVPAGIIPYPSRFNDSKIVVKSFLL